jgi:hypothetical protein
VAHRHDAAGSAPKPGAAEVGRLPAGAPIRRLLQGRRQARAPPGSNHGVDERREGQDEERTHREDHPLAVVSTLFRKGMAKASDHLKTPP